MTPSQQTVLIEAHLSQDEWYEHGQSGQAAKALARLGLVVLRPASGGVGNYTAPASKLTDEGRAVVIKLLKEDKNAMTLMQNAYAVINAKKNLRRNFPR